jgi:hypothetical protein
MTRAYRGILPALLLLMALLLFGCGGGGSSPSANPTPTPAPSRMEIIDTEPLTGFTNTSAVNREMTLLSDSWRRISRFAVKANQTDWNIWHELVD